MTPETKLVLQIVKEVVFDKKESLSFLIEKGNINWEEFGEAIFYHEIAPFAYLSLKDYLYLLPEDLVKTLESNFCYTLACSSSLEQKLLSLYNMFKGKEINVVPIKGIAILGDLYSKRPVRPSSDIDVLVLKQDVPKAISVLKKAGYKNNLHGLKEEYWWKKHYHLCFKEIKPEGSNPTLELHWDLDYCRRGRKMMSDWFERLRDFKLQNKQIKVLSVEDTFFTLALHQRHYGKVLSLKYVCDIGLLLNKYSSIFDWDYVLKESKKFKLCSTVFFALLQAKLLLGIEVPPFVWRSLGVSYCKRSMMQRLIERDTFLATRRLFNKNIYLKIHFLLYDNFLEPMQYIINIPQEQFARFYEFMPYNEKTTFFYRLRLLYIPARKIIDLFKGSH